MTKHFITGLSFEQGAKAMWWVGTIFLVLGLVNLSRLDGTPGQVALVFIVPFMAWGAARNYRIRDLEQDVEQLADDSDDHEA